ncbi:hypothetical protein Q767_15340 [Flavobacterium enshiense DK69]|uniref:Helix-turn-helix domain-containing protein n=1 Tax=Flavobacterium enshiense DK69 TaxID=1107311 RepID=A0A0A2MX66_9FLAO|nr:hypothetical protein Q767_15340 [Flavobacterium enshiense DK69]
MEKAIEKLSVKEPSPSTDELLNVDQIAAYLLLAKSSIYGLTATSKIPHYKYGKKLYFKKSEIDDWILAKRIKTMDEIEQEAMEYIRNRPRFISSSKHKK